MTHHVEGIIIKESERISFDDFCFLTTTKDTELQSYWREIELLNILRKNKEIINTNSAFSLYMGVSIRLIENDDGSMRIQSPLDTAPKGFYELVENYYEFTHAIEFDNILLEKLLNVLEKIKNKD